MYKYKVITIITTTAGINLQIAVMCIVEFGFQKWPVECKDKPLLYRWEHWNSVKSGSAKNDQFYNLRNWIEIWNSNLNSNLNLIICMW